MKVLNKQTKTATAANHWLCEGVDGHGSDTDGRSLAEQIGNILHSWQHKYKEQDEMNLVNIQLFGGQSQCES